MGLDFCWLGEQKQPPRVTLNDRDIEAVLRAFEKLKDRTGVFVDPYADTRIAPEQAKVLIVEIEKTKADSDGIRRLLNLLDEAVKSSEWIIAVGD
ncbi:hypothetical protein [uncultured Roseibium sp.]|uniref:hypothetical protein n=1 Tax=uncultured Roseibium sp. TaxID=1936171 RepID=UPI0032168B78